jgi:hypothetical protein
MEKGARTAGKAEGDEKNGRPQETARALIRRKKSPRTCFQAGAFIFSTRRLKRRKALKLPKKGSLKGTG